jgi:hypothetical protein
MGSEAASTPTTSPDSPTSSAARNDTSPAPHPTSRTLIPGAIPASTKKRRVIGSMNRACAVRRSSSRSECPRTYPASPSTGEGIVLPLHVDRRYEITREEGDATRMYRSAGGASVGTVARATPGRSSHAVSYRSRPPPSMPLQSRGMPVGRRGFRSRRSRGSRPLGPPPRCIQPQSPPARRQRVRRAGLDGSHPLTLQAKMLRASNS